MLLFFSSLNTIFGKVGRIAAGAASLAPHQQLKSRFIVTMGLLVGVSDIALAAYVGSGTTGAGERRV